MPALHAIRVKLSLRQKAGLYRELGQLLRSGIPFPSAVQTLLNETRGAVRKFLRQLRAAVDQGRTVGGAFAAQRPAVSHLEASIVSACDRSGRLEQGCVYLSGYFGKLDDARQFIIKKSAYPVFVLHFGVFVLALPRLVLGGSGHDYLNATFGFLLLLYGCCFIVALLASILTHEGALQPFTDRLLRLIPGVGKMRRAFALARFCATYEMQLQSGVNVIDSLSSAGAASQSALVIAAVRKAVPQIRTGAQVGPLLSGSNAFTEAMIRAIRIGEETGELDRELKRLAEAFQQEAVTRLETLATVFSKLIYFAVVIYVGSQIVQGYAAYLHKIDSIGFDK